MTTFHLWADFETTGLNPEVDSILEAAWTITDTELRMLTPLRSRLCNIAPEGRRSVEHLNHPLSTRFGFGIGDRQDGDEGDWGRLPQVVRDMHATSRLRDELELAKRDPVENLRLLTTAGDLGRLIKEDLATVGYDRFDDTLVLSGAGVSHFDNRVFAVHLPDLFPLGGHGTTGFAYWQHDVSVAIRVIGEQAWEQVKASAADLPASHPVFRCESASPLSEGYAPVSVQFTTPATPLAPADLAFDVDGLTAHRAADDVVRALIDGRMLLSGSTGEVK